MGVIRSPRRWFGQAMALALLAASAAACAAGSDPVVRDGWRSGDVLVYDMEFRDRTLGRWATKSVSRSTLTLRVDEVVPGGETRVRMQQEDCALVEAEEDTPPGMLAAQRYAVEGLCGPPLDVRIADGTDAVTLGNAEEMLAHLGNVVAGAFGLLPSADADDGATDRAIEAIVTEDMVVSDVREHMRLFRIPPDLLPASFEDERPNPYDDTPSIWTHEIAWLEPDATGQRRARWTMSPDPAAIRTALLTQWSRGLGGDVPSGSNLGRALAGDVDLSLTTEYSFDAAGIVVHSLAIDEMRFGDDHRRNELEARLRPTR